MGKFFEEFKQFAVKGNVADLAIGVIIGGAFGKIASSLVNDIIMPVLSIIIGRYNISALVFTIDTPSADSAPIQIKYGMFLQNILDFVLIALSVFLVIRMINIFRKKHDEAEIKAAPAEEIVLLTEIRDLLKNK